MKGPCWKRWGQEPAQMKGGAGTWAAGQLAMYPLTPVLSLWGRGQSLGKKRLL